jgi:hypothetical protein
MPINAANLVQYQPLSAPVSVPAQADAPQTCDRWLPRSQDRPRAKPRPMGGMSGPLFIPDVTNPVSAHSWKPTYPDRVPARKPRTVTAQVSVYPLQEPVPPPVPGGSFISTGAAKLLQYQSLTGPLGVPDFIGGDKADPPPAYPDRLYPKRSLHASQHPAFFFDKFTAPTPAVVPDGSWLPTYPERVWPKRALKAALHPFWTSDRFDAPNIPIPAPDSSWQPVYPDRHRRLHRLGAYIWAQQHFAVVTQVPVMAWTGWYLDPPVLRRSPRAALNAGGVQSFDVPGTLTPAAPDYSWPPRYVDRVADKPRSLAALLAGEVGPAFVPDVTQPVPPLVWVARYPDRIYPRLALAAQLRPSVFADTLTAPAPVIAPDLSQAVYPDRVYARRPLTHHPALIWPPWVPDVSEPAPPMSWAAIYPDMTKALRRVAHFTEFYTRIPGDQDAQIVLFRRVIGMHRSGERSVDLEA